MEDSAKIAAYPIRWDVPGVVDVSVESANIRVTVAPQAWDVPLPQRCALLKSIMDKGLNSNRGIAVPIEVVVKGQEIRAAVSVRDGGHDHWVVMPVPAVHVAPTTTQVADLAIGDDLYNSNNGVEIGRIVALDPNHAFPDGRIGEGVLIARPDGSQIWLSGAWCRDNAKKRS